jgi:hypothetical protein
VETVCPHLKHYLNKKFCRRKICRSLSINTTLEVWGRGHCSGTVSGACSGSYSGSGGPVSLCSQTFSSGAQATETATASNPTTCMFAGWKGDYTGNNPASLSMYYSMTITANFSCNTNNGYYWNGAQCSLLPPITQTLTVNGNGNCKGSVANCGTYSGSGGPSLLCQKTFNAGSTVSPSLTASPDNPATCTFAGWSGACTGTSSCAPVMDQPHSVTANFYSTTTYSLQVLGQGTCGGTISGDLSGNYPDGGSATSSSFIVSGIFNQNAQPSLTATANNPSTCNFGGWTGDCTGTAGCSLTMTANKQVTANFCPVNFIWSPSYGRCVYQPTECSNLANYLSSNQPRVCSYATPGTSFYGQAPYTDATDSCVRFPPQYTQACCFDVNYNSNDYYTYTGIIVKVCNAPSCNPNNPNQKCNAQHQWEICPGPGSPTCNNGYCI